MGVISIYFLVIWVILWLNLSFYGKVGQLDENKFELVMIYWSSKRLTLKVFPYTIWTLGNKSIVIFFSHKSENYLRLNSKVWKVTKMLFAAGNIWFIIWFRPEIASFYGMTLYCIFACFQLRRTVKKCYLVFPIL